MTSSNSDPGRSAGLLEKFHIIRGHLHADAGVVVTGRYIMPNGSLDRQTLYPALAHVLQKHRALSTQVHGADTKEPFFVPLKSVDLSQVVRFHGNEDKQLNKVIEPYLLNQLEYATTNPLWELGILPDNTVIFHFDHSIGDGQSGLAFHKLLQSALNTVKSSQPEDDPSPIILIPETLPLQPRLEDAMDLSLSLGTICREVFSSFLPLSWRKASSSWTGNSVAMQDQMNTSVRTWTLTPEQAAFLLKLCRDKHTTITSFLYTTSLVIFNTLLHDTPKRYKRVTIEIPVSLRCFTKAPADVFCDQVSSITFLPPITRIGPEAANDLNALAAQFPWSMAAGHTATVQKKVSTCAEHTASLKLLFGQYLPFFEGKIGKKRKATLEISNVGRFPSDKSEQEGKGEWHIEEMIFAQSDGLFGAAIKLCAIGSQDGSLGLSFCWSRGAVEDDFAQLFVDRFRNLVEAILRNVE